MSEIAIIGAGAWGTSLSIVLGRKSTHRIRLRTRRSLKMTMKMMRKMEMEMVLGIKAMKARDLQLIEPRSSQVHYVEFL